MTKIDMKTELARLEQIPLSERAQAVDDLAGRLEEELDSRPSEATDHGSSPPQA